MEEPSHQPGADAPEAPRVSKHPDHGPSAGSTWKRTNSAGATVPPSGRYEHFEILRREDGSLWQLGSGAMGTTFKALDTRLQHHVALKVVSADLTSFPAARERFLREARTAARLHHPNVVRIFHLGETGSGSAAFYAMEYIEGETLEARVRRGGPLSAWLTLEIGIEVARALVAACQQDLIHRDLKPANLMLVASAEAATVATVGADSSHGEASEAWVKVIDFGLAKAMVGAGPLTGVGDFIGTPAYASPEQFTGGVREVDGRSDIYSLGGTLWYALTGRMPFEGSTITAIERQKFSDAPRAAQLAAGGVPPPLAYLIAAMLAADAGDRPQTPSILLEALRRCRAELRLSVPVVAGQTRADSFFWTPLRRFRHRRIYQVFLGYAVGAWLLLQIVAIVLPNLDWPRWIMRALIVTLLAGFGEALFLGWILDRRAAGQALLPQSAWRKLGILLLALAPAAMTAAFFVRYPVSSGAIKEARSTTSEAAVESIPAKSVAVLPFENLSSERNNAFFAEGVQDEILTDLSKVADLKVISRASIRQYRDARPPDLREVARLLGVAYVVEGGVQRAGNKVRVSARLIDARTGAQQWAERYDRDVADVFAIQSEIALAIAGQLQAAISPQEKQAMSEIPTHDEQAYQFYLRALMQLNDYDSTLGGEESHRNVLELLRQATVRDPGFTRAFALMTQVQADFYFNFERTPANADAARADAEMTARLRPGSSDAHAAAGYYEYYVRRDSGRALEEFSEVIRQSPNDAKAYLFLGALARRKGNWETALGPLRRALDLDPESSVILNSLNVALLATGHTSELEALLSRRIAAHPEQFWWRERKVTFLLDSKGDTRSALAEVALLPPGSDARVPAISMRVECNQYDRNFAAAERDLAACPLTEIYGVPKGVYEGFNAYYQGDLAKAVGLLTKARPLLEARTQAANSAPGWVWELAKVDAVLGEKEAALALGRRARAMDLAGDPLNENSATTQWALVLAWVSERDEAIRTLQGVCGKPFGPGYGNLRLNPEWDGLRSDPRFEAMVASLAPKPSSP